MSKTEREVVVKKRRYANMQTGTLCGNPTHCSKVVMQYVETATGKERQRSSVGRNAYQNVYKHTRAYKVSTAYTTTTIFNDIHRFAELRRIPQTADTELHSVSEVPRSAGKGTGTREATHARQAKVDRLPGTQAADKGDKFSVPSFEAKITRNSRVQWIVFAQHLVLQRNGCGGICFSSLFGFPIGGERV